MTAWTTLTDPTVPLRAAICTRRGYLRASRTAADLPPSAEACSGAFFRTFFRARFFRAYFRAYFFAFSPVESVESAAMNASWGTSTRPTIFIRFLPSFCFSSSLRFRVMSPP